MLDVDSHSIQLIFAHSLLDCTRIRWNSREDRLETLCVLDGSLVPEIPITALDDRVGHKALFGLRETNELGPAPTAQIVRKSTHLVGFTIHHTIDHMTGILGRHDCNLRITITEHTPIVNIRRANQNGTVIDDHEFCVHVYLFSDWQSTSRCSLSTTARVLCRSQEIILAQCVEGDVLLRISVGELCPQQRDDALLVTIDATIHVLDDVAGGGRGEVTSREDRKNYHHAEGLLFQDRTPNSEIDGLSNTIARIAC
mmetsp:Transcript_13436/g.34271  ORF Transcript_13436/g.34271 Transcript_13436/m.34271 type:complete len:255 (+) Transcript_13436:283-1047(+)